MKLLQLSRALTTPVKQRDLVSLWNICERLPLANLLFRRLYSRSIPYASTIPFEVACLKHGHCELTMRPRRSILDGSDTIHTMAVANLAEVSTRLALVSTLPREFQIELGEIQIDYAVPARGTVKCTAQYPQQKMSGNFLTPVRSDLHNSVGDLVAVATMTWKVNSLER